MNHEKQNDAPLTLVAKKVYEMKKLVILIAAFACVPAYAVDNVLTWTQKIVTAGELVKNGFELKSVNYWIDTEILYFQKGSSLYRCGTVYGKTKTDIENSKCEKLAAQ